MRVKTSVEDEEGAQVVALKEEMDSARKIITLLL